MPNTPKIHCRVAVIVLPLLILAVTVLGIDGGGNTLPGPPLPFGMIKTGPDMDSGIDDWNAGNRVELFTSLQVRLA